MNSTPQKRTAARRRATCVRELRRWQQRKRRRPPFDQVIAELRARYPDLPMSQRSLYRWSDLAGDPIDPAHLIDTRGGHRVRAWTVQSAWITRRWWINHGSSIRPTRAESRMVARLQLDDEARAFALHRLRVARALLDLERRAGLPIHTAARHLIDQLRQVKPGVRVSRSSAVYWARLYRQDGAAAVAGLLYRRAAGWPRRRGQSKV